ncbi:MAG TPA: cupin domain-containing protein [Thermoclostridium sp.]|nr:cupin domain-containing protein [Clostridiaceae bacterium]HOQ75440.1 cupin domain-containing protein [Thermoclostridium sp.]HPU45339.1 cupin domain-containing protein [Thermoclostridium sp.]
MLKRVEEMKKEIRERMRDGKGSVELQHVFIQDELTGKCRLFARVTLKPGCSIGTHTHDREEEIYYIISGTATVDDNGEIRTLRPGDAVLTGNGAYHSIENAGDEDLVLMAVILLYD